MGNHFEAQIAFGEDRTAGDESCSLEDGAKFAEIAGPGIILQRRRRGIGD